MNFDFSTILRQIVDMYKGLSLAQKVGLPILFIFAVGSIVAVSKWASRPEYGVLFSNLQQNSAAGIVQQLKAKKINYELQDNGKTILVAPASMISELRLELASSDITVGNGSVGFELFKENSFGRTGFVEKLMGVQALQGELERTITSISAVESVRVHITKPDRSVFVTRDVAPTASVFLNLKPGTSLEKKQIKGIANLVANAVEGLKGDNITIVDSAGNQLNAKQGDASDEIETVRLEYQRKLEQGYERRIETMLVGILGEGKVIARVTADLNFNKVEKEEESYDPASKVTRSERILLDKTGATDEVGGVSGVMSNLQNQKGLLTNPDSDPSIARKESVINYEVSRSVSRTTAQLGRLNRLSVAVMVDGNYTANPNSVETEYKPLTSDMVKQIETLVKQSVGYDATRGDVVSVENIRFAGNSTTITPADPTNVLGINVDLNDKNFLFKMTETIVPFFIALLFFIFMVRPLVKTLLTKSNDVNVDLSRLLPSGISELEAELELERKKLSSTVATLEDEQEIDIEELEGLIASNAKLVKEDPQQAALLIRYWLNDGKTL